MLALGAKHQRPAPSDAASTDPQNGASAAPTLGPDVPTADFEAVYEAHFDFVWRSLRRLGVPSSSVDDAAQDVFLVVHRRLAEFEGRSKLRTWIFGIALRVARSHRRRLARKGQLDPLPEGLAADTDDPEREVEKRQAADFLEGFLEQLDEDKRAVFVLAELEQMTAPEIEQALGVKLNTVYSRLRSARQAFEGAVKRHLARDARSDRSSREA